MPIASGVYIITNVLQGNPVFFESPDDEVPLRGRYKSEDDSERWHWNIIDRNNGRHTIQNVKYQRYANCGSRAGLKDPVRGDGREQLWHIQESRDKGEYTIAATDSRNFWMLPDSEEETPVELFNVPTDQRCWWTFTNLETGAPVNGDATNPAFLFELKPLPILPFSPLKLDFIIIQPMSNDSTSNASRTLSEVCGPLVSSRRPQSDALCVNMIEFTSFGLNIFFQRSYDVMTFDKLCNLGGTDVSWKQCGGVPSLPKMAMRGLRDDTTKVAILNLNAHLVQHGGRAIIELIKCLAEHDITLILTPIQSTFELAFSDSAVATELMRLYPLYRRFEQEGEFAYYLGNYHGMVALPRLTESPGLRKSIRSNIPHVMKVLKHEDHDAQSAAIATLSQLAEYAELRDEIIQIVPKIVDMLKSNGGEAEAAASALINLTAHAELYDVIFKAVLKIVEMLGGPGRSPTFFERTKLRGLGAKPKDRFNCTSLAWAAARGSDALVRILLAQKGVEVNSKDTNGATPLYIAAKHGHNMVVQLLLAHGGVDVNSKATRDWTSLHVAAYNGHDTVVRLLLAQEDVDVNSKETTGGTPLYIAAEHGHDTVVRLLLAQEDVDVNSKETRDWTSLHVAAYNGHDTVVRLLLAQEGVDVNSKRTNGVTPLYIAAQNGHDTTVRLLLAQDGVEVNSKPKTGATPLYIAAQNGHSTVVRLLLAQEGVDINSEDTGGRTPLHIASINGHNAVVRLLLEHEGVNVNVMCHNGKAPLMYAEKYKHKAVARLLQEKIASMGNATQSELVR